MRCPNTLVAMADKTNQAHFPTGNVFIKNLDRCVDSNSLHQAFSSFGNILSCKVPHGKKGSKCHGFVQFESESAADAAISKMNGTIFYGKKLFVGHFLNREQRETTADNGPTGSVASSSLRTVYIKNLNPSVDSVFLKITCSPYGDVCNVKIIRDTDGSSKGFAFVTFKKVEEAEKAIEMLNGREVDGRILFAGPAMKKAGKKHLHQVQHQQQHDFKEIIIEDSINIEQQQQHHVKQQQRQFQRQQQPQSIQAKRANLLPAMPNQPTQQHTLQYEPASQLPLGTLFPCINNPYYPAGEDNAMLQLPEIQQHFQQQQKKLHHHQQPQPKQEQHYPQLRPQHQLPLHDQHQKETPCEEDREADQHPKQQQSEECPNIETTAPNTALQGVNLYVKHLDEEVDDATLKGMFSKFGEVISAKVMMEGEKSRGFGFVCFARSEDAARATRDMRRRVDDVNRKPLYVAPAQRKEERQAFFREKLKSRQNESHNGDIETTTKLLKSLDNNKDIEQKENSDVEGQVFVNLPGGDSSNTSVKPKYLNGESAKCNEMSGQTRNIHQIQRGTKLLEHREPLCTKLQNSHRSCPKRNSLFNFECFNVENLRTPLIKPTRLENPAEERTSFSPLSRSDVDSGPLFPFRVGGDSGQICGVATPSNTLCPVFAGKSPDGAKCTNNFGGIGRSNQNLAWRSLDCKDENLVSSKAALLKQSEETPTHLTPIGCCPKSLDSECKSHSVRNSAETLKSSQNCNTRSRPPNRLSPSLSDSKGDCTSESCLQVKTKKVPKEDISFSGSTQNIPEYLACKKDISTFDTLYDPQNAIPFSRSAILEVNSPFSRNTMSQYSFACQRSSTCSDTESYTTCCEHRQIITGLRRGFASNESLLSLDPLRSLKTRTGSDFQEPVTRRSPNLKRRSDSAFDADMEDFGMGINGYWRSKRRMIALPPQYSNEHGPGYKARPPSPALSVPCQGEFSLRTMTNLPTDQQKLVLIGTVRTHLNEALKNMVESCCDSDQSPCWSPETIKTVHSLLDKNWDVITLSDKLTGMVMEMGVTEILSLLQSKDYLTFLITEGLAQIENVFGEATVPPTAKVSTPSDLETLTSASESCETESTAIGD